MKQGIAEVDRRARARAAKPFTDTLKVTFITASLRALPGEGALPTHERSLQFTAADFRYPTRWDAIATAAAASATFPGLFAPTLINGDPCVDGGAVNNAPISYLLDEDSAVDSVITISTQPLAPDPPPSHLGGVTLISHLADAISTSAFRATSSRRCA